MRIIRFQNPIWNPFLIQNPNYQENHTEKGSRHVELMRGYKKASLSQIIPLFNPAK